MKETIIKYETVKIGALDLYKTICPMYQEELNKRVFIGSSKCQQCSWFNGINKKEKTIKCLG